MNYVVIDHEGHPSYSAKKDAPESFATLAAAEKRAREIAGCEPGETVRIYEIAVEVIAPVGKVEVRRHR